MEFSGQVAIVTGAARGIGEAVARDLASRGAAVALADIADCSPVVDSITQQGGLAASVRCDVTDQAQVENLVAWACERFGRLDLLVTCAVFSLRGAIWEQPMEDVQSTVNVTMWGTYYSVRAAAKRLVEQQSGGCIIVIGSPHATVPVPDCSAYNMAKAAVVQLALTAAAELVPHRVRVNVVHPGWTNTPGERRFFSEEQIAKAAVQLPAGRLADPKEIARAVAFLACPASEYINGSSLTVDGGLSLPLEQIVG